jgi:hypothetical protein
MLTRRARTVRCGMNGSTRLVPPRGQSAAGGRTRWVLRYAAIIATVTGSAALPLVAASPARADQVRQRQEWVLDAMDVPAAWHVTQGRHVIVAVIDSGVDPTVADLSGSVLTGPNFSGVNTPPSNPNWGDHGTWMASLIAGHGHGRGDQDGILGVAPQARVLSIRVITDRTDPDYAKYQAEPPGKGLQELATAIRYAVDHHAGVISMSLGYDAPSLVVRSALQFALSRNVVVVASSGNSGTAQTASGQGIAPYSFPADYPGVMGVAAVSQSGQPAYFSSDNLSVQIAAPGVNVPAAGRGNKYWLVSGTSPACALTAGVAALIRSRYPRLTAEQVRRAIVRSGSHRPAGGYDDEIGFGTVDAAAALRTAGMLAREPSAGTSAAAKAAASGHFGDGPKAVPQLPVAPRGREKLLVLLAIAAAFGLITLASLWRFGTGLVRRRSDRRGLPVMPAMPAMPTAAGPDRVPAGPIGVIYSPYGPGGQQPLAPGQPGQPGQAYQPPSYPPGSPYQSQPGYPPAGGYPGGPAGPAGPGGGYPAGPVGPLAPGGGYPASGYATGGYPGGYAAGGYSAGSYGYAGYQGSAGYPAGTGYPADPGATPPAGYERPDFLPPAGYQATSGDSPSPPSGYQPPVTAASDAGYVSRPRFTPVARDATQPGQRPGPSAPPSPAWPASPGLPLTSGEPGTSAQPVGSAQPAGPATPLPPAGSGTPLPPTGSGTPLPPTVPTMPVFKPVQASETGQSGPADGTSGTAQNPLAPDSGHDYLGSRYVSLGYRGAATDPGSRRGAESAAPQSRAARQPGDTDPGRGIFPRVRPVDDSGSSRWFTPQTSEPRSDPAQAGPALSDSVTSEPARPDPGQHQSGTGPHQLGTGPHQPDQPGTGGPDLGQLGTGQPQPGQPEPAQSAPAGPGRAEPLPRRLKPADLTAPAAQPVPGPPSASTPLVGRAPSGTGETAAEPTAAAPGPGSPPDGHAAPGAS